MRSLRVPLWALACFAVSFTVLTAACGSDDEEQEAAAKAAEEKRKRERSASTDFVPVEAPGQPPLPPNAGPYNGPPPNDDDDPDPMPDSGSGSSSGGMDASSDV